MREILFKAKRIDNGEWVEGYVVKFGKESSDEKDRFGILDKTILTAPIKHTNGKVTMMQPDYAYHNIKIVEVNPSTICQYTGLTDKNGNKIWENDVVWVCETDRAIVIFSEKHSGYILQPIGDYYFDSPMLVDNVDIIDNIIGNIFDNPELLEGAQHEQID